MRNRTIAGLAAGALGAGVLALPAFTGAAVAAPSTLALDGDFTCIGEEFGFTMTMDYDPGLSITADGTSVSATSVAASKLMNADGPKDFPTQPAPGFQVKGLDLTVKTTLNGESVTLTGSSTSAGSPTSSPVPVPALSGSRAGSGALESGVINSVSGAVHLFVPYTPGVPSYEVSLTCTGSGVPVTGPTSPTTSPTTGPTGTVQPTTGPTATTKPTTGPTGTATPTTGPTGTVKPTTGPTATTKPTTAPTATTKPTTAPTATTKPTTAPTATTKPTTAPTVTAPAGGAVMTCVIPAFSTTMSYPTKVNVSAAAKGSKVEVTAKLDAMPGLVPVPLDKTPVEGVLTAKIDGKSAQLKGSNTITIAPRANIPVPALTGSVASKASKVDVVIEKASFKAVHPLMTVAFECTLPAPHKVAGVKVAAEKVTKAASTAKVTKVSYSKKTKKATVKVKVTGKKGKATGKATITIKRGKATVAKKAVKLKNGKATWKSKKITKKGTYKVTVKYTGSKTYKASKVSKAKKFKIKK